MDNTEYEVPTGFKRWSIVIAAVLGTALFDLTWMIVGVALPHMQGTFSATPDQISWVMTSFIVGGTMMVSITGWASTRFGRKQLFVFSMVGNTIATVMCGAAGSLEAEVFWRFVQGLLSGPLLAIGQSLVISAFPQEKRGFATGLWGAAGVGAVVFAPVLGGYLIEYVNWRWIFYAVIPIGIAGTICTIAFVPRSEPSPARSLEWTGFAALILLVGTVQLGLSRGERLEWFESTEIRVHFLIAVLALAVVVYRVMTVPQPILERRIFLDKNYVVSIVFMFLFGGLTTLPVILLPLMLQQIAGYPAIAAGEVMMGKGVGTMTSLLLVGLLMNRIDPRLILAVGFSTYAGANFYMSTWTATVDQWDILWTLVLMGSASGTVYVPIVSVSLATMARRLHTEAITFMFLTFNVGSAVGVAAIFALHTRLSQVNRAVLVEHISETNELLRMPRVANSIDLETASGLAALSAEISRQAQIIAYVNSYLFISIAAALVLPLILVLKKPNPANEVD